ncbi:MAG: hypothetical protein ACKVUS_05630 [Saprospiraceae bacterium]
MTSKQIKQKIHSHLHKGEIEDALDFLISGLVSQQRRDYDNALMLKAKWEGLKQEQLRGVISRQEYELAISKVIAGIQTITNEVDKIEENNTGHKIASSRSFNRVWIAAGIVCLIGISAWYLASKDWTQKQADAIDPNLPKMEQIAENDPNKQKEAVNTTEEISPNQEPKIEAPTTGKKEVEAQGPTASAEDVLAAKGEIIANQDPLAIVLRNREPKGPSRRGFDIGMAAAEGHTLPGPGKDKMCASLKPAEQIGFKSAVAFSLERNRNLEFAAIGADIAKKNPIVAAARTKNPSVYYSLGFDIATGIFGDPKLGAQGNTAKGTGSLKIRDSLSADGQKGFNASMQLHLGPPPLPRRG